jgi:hypothetical protein
LFSSSCKLNDLSWSLGGNFSKCGFFMAGFPYVDTYIYREVWRFVVYDTWLTSSQKIKRMHVCAREKAKLQGLMFYLMIELSYNRIYSWTLCMKCISNPDLIKISLFCGFHWKRG